MTGAEALIRTLLAGGVNTCFTNPGTSEIHLVAALDRLPEMRCVLGLFEGVVTGAADGYARMTRKPAWTLLHLGPGLANGLANLHNARRAQVPLINVVGQHATGHLRHDTPLSSDIEAIARPYSGWLRTTAHASQIAADTADAMAAAQTAPGRIATLIVPADVSWSESSASFRPYSAPRPSVPAPETIERAAAMLRSGVATALLIAGSGLYGAGLRAAGRIAKATGAKLLTPYPLTRLERGGGLPVVERVHYILEQAQEQFQEFRQVILVGAPAPLPYFAYQHKEGRILAPDCAPHTLSGAAEDAGEALQILSTALGVEQGEAGSGKQVRPALPAGGITQPGIAAAIGALLPENAIVVDESMTSGRGLMPATASAPSHDWLGNTGGSIGIAMPLAAGAAIACPQRPVLCLTADGSGMYTLQALWTMAREALHVVTVVFANRSYAVLKREFSSLGIGAPGPRVMDLFEIGRPDLDWVQLARGLGVPARRVTSLEELAAALRDGFEGSGPALIEVPLP